MHEMVVKELLELVKEIDLLKETLKIKLNKVTCVTITLIGKDNIKSGPIFKFLKMKKLLACSKSNFRQ